MDITTITGNSLPENDLFPDKDFSDNLGGEMTKEKSLLADHIITSLLSGHLEVCEYLKTDENHYHVLLKRRDCDK